MKPGVAVGVSGHQTRPGLDWDWVRARLRESLTREAPLERAFTSLAVGSDQLFAEEALAFGVPVTAVIPMPDYERCFDAQSIESYRALLARSTEVQLPGAASDEAAFFAAGIWIAEACDVLVAIWDGKPAAGLGGTGDIVDYCQAHGRRVIHINPMTLTVRDLAPTPT